MSQVCLESSFIIFLEICWNKMPYLEHKFLRYARPNWFKKLLLTLSQTPWDQSFQWPLSHSYLWTFSKRVTLKCLRWCWMVCFPVETSRTKLPSILSLIQCLDVAEMKFTMRRFLSGLMKAVFTIPKTWKLMVLNFQCNKNTRSLSVSTVQTLFLLKRRMNWWQRWNN